jgi:hypothetical protein
VEDFGGAPTQSRAPGPSVCPLAYTPPPPHPPHPAPPRPSPQDRVVKQLDALKKDPSAAAAVRRFLDRGLDELGPAGHDVLTVLGAHEGEGMVLDRWAGRGPGPRRASVCTATARQARLDLCNPLISPSSSRRPATPPQRNAAVAGSRSRGGADASSDKGQVADLSIIEVALFFQSEILAAAAAASPGGGGAAAGGAMPVALLTNDNGARAGLSRRAALGSPAFALSSAAPAGALTPTPSHTTARRPAGQLQLAKSHGLPAFKLTPNAPFDAALRGLLTSGAPLTSAALRGLLAPAATAGLNTAKPGRGLQEEFDGAVACLKGLLAAYEDLSGALSEVADAASDDARPPAEALARVRGLLAARPHAQPFDEGGGGSGGGDAAGEGGGGAGGRPLLEAVKANADALAARLAAWDGVVRSHQAPSRVVKWAM